MLSRNAIKILVYQEVDARQYSDWDIYGGYTLDLQQDIEW